MSQWWRIVSPGRNHLPIGTVSTLPINIIVARFLHSYRIPYSLTKKNSYYSSQSILTVLADHLDHVEYVSKITPILRKLAPVLSEREFRMVWCLQKGRYGSVC